ncbi:MAG: transcriptional repressor LexA, partial [Pseudomonadota bacterium]|nr:transcriptional repressor LexA [Pseudomonadota bacterium]
LGLRSKSGIHRLITGLEERGFIKRLAHRARALEIIRLPDGHEIRQAKGISRKARLQTGVLADLPAIAAAQSISLRLFGRIAAGTPIEALRNPDGHFEVPAGLLASTKGRVDIEAHYALEVSGDSMIEAGIMDGDHVVIRKCDTAENGAIVVALVEGHEATLKFLERRGDHVALIPANKNYETRLYPPDHVEVQGKLVGLVRHY